MAASALNPHAPIFVPSAYRSVEDFSDQWWDLVQSSRWFRDYWLRECFADILMESPFSDLLNDFTFPVDNNDDGDILINNKVNGPATKGKKENLELVTLGWLKWRKQRGGAEMTSRYCNKAPKIVNMKVSPKPIQQPR